MREWLIRLLASGRRGRRDDQVDDELRFHLEELARGFERSGLDPVAARAAAERELGGLGRTKQAWRDQRSLVGLEETRQDVRYGLRLLRRSPGFSLLAGLMLALAVGATTLLFTVVDAVLLAPLPYAHADRLAVVWEEYLPLHAPNVSVAPGNFLEWQDRARSLAALTAVEQRQQNLTADKAPGTEAPVSSLEPQQVNVGAVSRGFERTVGVQPALGRLFAAGEFEPGHENVAVVSHAIWAGRYGRAPILGRVIVLDDRPYTVIGVMPDGFLFPTPQQQLWVPLPMTAADRENRTGHGLFTVARVRDGVSIAAASRELHDIAETLRAEFPDSNKDMNVTVVPAREAMVGKTTEVLRAMAGAVALLVLVACANVAGLLLTHGVARGRELAIRSALGASRVRIVRQLLTESMLLALAGASVGVALAIGGQPLIQALRPADLLAWKPVALDGRALAFSAVTAVVCGLVFGTLPALVASRANIAAAASARSAGRQAVRARQALVAIEVALAVVLVAGAALLGQTLAHLTGVDPGFNPDSVVTMTVALPPTRYGDDRRVNLFYRELFDRLRAIPGVRAAGAVHALPLSGSTSVRPYEVAGAPVGNARPVAHYRIVVPGYVEAMGIPLRAGRSFTDRDTADRPLVAMVNETLRRQAWGDRNPIGDRITFGGTPGSDGRWAEVVGLVADVRHFGPGTPAPPEMYWPAEQIDRIPGETLRRFRRGLTLVLSSASGDPSSLVPSVRAAVRAVDPDQPIADVRTMTSLMGASLWLARAAAWIVALFATTAAMFALLGASGAASYAVAERHRELAVRLALGADPDRVVRLVLAGTLRAAIAGVAIGLALALVLGRSVASLLVGVAPTDPRTLAVVCVSLALATVAACWLPARRAAGIEPMQALRVD